MLKCIHDPVLSLTIFLIFRYLIYIQIPKYLGSLLAVLFYWGIMSSPVDQINYSVEMLCHNGNEVDDS